MGENHQRGKDEAYGRFLAVRTHPLRSAWLSSCRKGVAVEGDRFDDLHEGQKVSFTEGRSPKGPCAENVKPM